MKKLILFCACIFAAQVANADLIKELNMNPKLLRALLMTAEPTGKDGLYQTYWSDNNDHGTRLIIMPTVYPE